MKKDKIENENSSFIRLYLMIYFSSFGNYVLSKYLYTFFQFLVSDR